MSLNVWQLHSKSDPYMCICWELLDKKLSSLAMNWRWYYVSYITVSTAYTPHCMRRMFLCRILVLLTAWQTPLFPLWKSFLTVMCIGFSVPHISQHRHHKHWSFPGVFKIVTLFLICRKVHREWPLSPCCWALLCPRHSTSPSCLGLFLAHHSLPALTTLFPSNSEVINTLWSLCPQDLFPLVGPDTKWQLGPERKLF